MIQYKLDLWKGIRNIKGQASGGILTIEKV